MLSRGSLSDFCRVSIMVCIYTLVTVLVLLGYPILWTLVTFTANTGGNVPTGLTLYLCLNTIYTNILTGLSWRWNFKDDFFDIPY